jgi:hypothetical protein
MLMVATMTRLSQHEQAEACAERSACRNAGRRVPSRLVHGSLPTGDHATSKRREPDRAWAVWRDMRDSRPSPCTPVHARARPCTPVHGPAHPYTPVPCLGASRGGVSHGRPSGGGGEQESMPSDNGMDVASDHGHGSWLTAHGSRLADCRPGERGAGSWSGEWRAESRDLGSGTRAGGSRSSRWGMK